MSISKTLQINTATDNYEFVGAYSAYMKVNENTLRCFTLDLYKYAFLDALGVEVKAICETSHLEIFDVEKLTPFIYDDDTDYELSNFFETADKLAIINSDKKLTKRCFNLDDWYNEMSHLLVEPTKLTYLFLEVTKTAIENYLSLIPANKVFKLDITPEQYMLKQSNLLCLDPIEFV